MKKNIIYGFVLLSTVSLNSFSADDLGLKNRFLNEAKTAFNYINNKLHSAAKIALSEEMRKPIAYTLAIGSLTAISYVGIKAAVKHFASCKKDALVAKISSTEEKEYKEEESKKESVTE
jgi:hypothetical protein